MTWRPLFEKLRKKHSEDALHEGVPEWMWPGLVAWLEPIMARSRENLLSAQQSLRVSLDWSQPYPEANAWKHLQRWCRSDQELALELVNLVLAWLPNRYQERERVERLAALLYRSGSAWTVRLDEDGNFALERRVSKEIEERARSVMDVADRGAEHLKIAWHALYSRDPNPDKAHEHAIKAVEAAGGVVIAPNDSKVTLGRMLGEMRSNPDRWRVTGSPSPSHDQEPAQAIRCMMELIWESHDSRHGSPDPQSPITTDPDVAETAVHVAISLVHLFREGRISQI